MARLRFGARLASAASILIMGAGMAAPVMALKMGGFKAAPAATVATAHAPATRSGGQATAATNSNPRGNAPGWQTNCNPKNHYCPTPSPSPCADDETSGSLVSDRLGQPGLGCNYVDPALDHLDFLCPPEPLGSSSTVFCVPSTLPTASPNLASRRGVPLPAAGLRP